MRLTVLGRQSTYYAISTWNSKRNFPEPEEGMHKQFLRSSFLFWSF